MLNWIHQLLKKKIQKQQQDIIKLKWECSELERQLAKIKADQEEKTENNE